MRRGRRGKGRRRERGRRRREREGGRKHYERKARSKYISYIVDSLIDISSAWRHF